MNWLMQQINLGVRNGVAWINDMIPSPPPEAADACATIAAATDQAAPLGVFVPFSAIVFGVGLIVATAAIVVVVRLFRITLSLRTGGGGA